MTENDTRSGVIDTNGVYYYYGGLAAGFILMFGTEAFLARPYQWS